MSSIFFSKIVDIVIVSAIETSCSQVTYSFTSSGILLPLALARSRSDIISL